MLILLFTEFNLYLFKLMANIKTPLGLHYYQY